jgi:ADP-dependent NAD(P)H-hydrate dehydratase
LTEPVPINIPALPARDPAGHKGTFGTVAIIGGCSHTTLRMIGAPALSARAALRAGAGLARLVMPEPILSAGLVLCHSATGTALAVDGAGSIVGHEAAAAIDHLAATCQCLAIGPGMGDGEGVRIAALRAVQQEAAPVVVDADALTALATVPELARDFRAAAILTPHPGEFKRLAASLNIALDPVSPATRPAAAAALAQRLGCVVVLKGAGTIVSDGQRTWTNTSGHACLATAGTGDVLTGLIAGLVAQFFAPIIHPKLPRPAAKPLDLFDAARLAVYAHGLAGQRWAQQRHAAAGLLAEELADLLPEALSALG